jgi:hypothetical protein
MEVLKFEMNQVKLTTVARYLVELFILPALRVIYMIGNPAGSAYPGAILITNLGRR